MYNANLATVISILFVLSCALICILAGNTVCHHNVLDIRYRSYLGLHGAVPSINRHELFKNFVSLMFLHSIGMQGSKSNRFHMFQ